jgi:hypothetical protein
MDIKFVEDLKNSQMRVTIKLKKRNFVKEERIRLGWSGLKEIVDEQYECSSTHILGECINPYQKMDNNYDHLLEKTWIFDLLSKDKPKDKPKVKPKDKPKVILKKTSKPKKPKKTTVKK